MLCTVEPLLNGHLLSDQHLYAASSHSPESIVSINIAYITPTKLPRPPFVLPDNGSPTVFTSIKRPSGIYYSQFCCVLNAFRNLVCNVNRTHCLSIRFGNLTFA